MDDDEPVTEEWLKSTEWLSDNYGNPWYRRAEGPGVSVRFQEGTPRLAIFGYGVLPFNKITRGHVRRLCAALGIELKATQ